MFYSLKQLFREKNFKKYFANTSWLFVEKVFRIFVGLFVNIWIARYLGPNDFGLLSYAQSLIAIMMPLASLGLDKIVVRELINKPEKNEKILATSFRLKLAGSIASILALLVLVSVLKTDWLTKVITLIISTSLIFQSFNIIDLYFQSKVLSKYIVWSNIWGLVISSIIKILLILFKVKLIYFAVAYVFDYVLFMFGYLYFFLKKADLKFRLFSFSRDLAISLFKDSWPLILGGFAVGLYMKIDQVMLKFMVSNKAVGVYAAAVKLSESWYFIPIIITTSLFPAIVKAKKLGEVIYKQRLQQLYDLMSLLGISIGIFMTIFGAFLVKLLYGYQYLEAVNVLKVHIWAGVFVFLGIASSQWLMNENFTLYSLYRTLIGAILNIILNYFLIKKYGAMGAAVSTLLSYAIATFSLIFFKKCREQAIFMLKSFNIFRILLKGVR